MHIPCRHQQHSFPECGTTTCCGGASLAATRTLALRLPTCARQPTHAGSRRVRILCVDPPLPSQSRRLELLLRLTVGSIVLYEADAVRAAQREERLLGVILEDLGPGVGASGKQYKVGGWRRRGISRNALCTMCRTR